MSREDAGKVSAPIISFLGTRDGIPASGYEVRHGVWENAGIANKFNLYDGAQHSFFNDTRSSYLSKAAADAWEQTLNWWGQHLS